MSAPNHQKTTKTTKQIETAMFLTENASGIGFYYAKTRQSSPSQKTLIPSPMATCAPRISRCYTQRAEIWSTSFASSLRLQHHYATQPSFNSPSGTASATAKKKLPIVPPTPQASFSTTFSKTGAQPSTSYPGATTATAPSSTDLTHIDQLHHIGCQLAVLKRVYQSYSLIIERVLKKQEATLASLKNSHIMSGAQSFTSTHPDHIVNSTSGPMIPEADSLLGVSLSSAAKVRFERLKDRIALYALSEIEECMLQKESLVMMNFNLIAIKESFSVERLTWVTLLLAKITILFTPVTLMTGYFSIQFKDTEFEINGYWWTFAIVFGVSLFLLFLFSFFSGTFEGKKIVTRSWSRVAFDGGKRWMAGRRRKGKMG
jgi:Mg2+ and Co2+ transporter CorA